MRASAAVSSGDTTISGLPVFSRTAAIKCALCMAERPEISAGNRPLSPGIGIAAVSGLLKNSRVRKLCCIILYNMGCHAGFK